MVSAKKLVNPKTGTWLYYLLAVALGLPVGLPV
jgi:hypothetical protein